MCIIQSRLIFVFKMYLFKVFGAKCDFIFSEDEKKYLVHIYDNSHDSSIFTKIAKIKKDIEKNNCELEWAKKPDYVYGESFKISSDNLIKWILSSLKVDFREFNEWVFSDFTVMELLRKDLNAFVAYEPKQNEKSYVIFEYLERKDTKNIKDFLDTFLASYVMDEENLKLKIFVDSYNRLLMKYAVNGLI